MGNMLKKCAFSLSQLTMNTAVPVIRRSVGFSILLFLLGFARAQQPVFYFAAHEDDWQLFMGSQVFEDSRPDVKIVFVTLTAGDAGCGDGCPGTTSNMAPYYVAREQGSIATVKFMGDYQTYSSSDQISDIVETSVEINRHTVHKVVYRNMVAYFFRLPDGNSDGAGYLRTGHESLKRSRDHENPTLRAVDGSTTFANWDDLTATIRDLVLHETGAARYAWINVPNTDRAYNPNDHSDHYNTSYAAQDAMNGLRQFGFNGFMDYNTNTQPVNLDNERIEDKAALFGTINYELYLNGAFSTWEPTHKSWLSRDYSRVMQVPAPLLAQLRLPPPLTLVLRPHEQ